MRIFVALLVVLSVLYFWDREYNHGKLLDEIPSSETPYDRVAAGCPQRHSAA
jgi:hypothetical protein